MIVYAILVALARYPFHVLRPRSYGRAFRVRPRTAWVVTCGCAWGVAVVASLWPIRDVFFYVVMLAPPVVLASVMVAIATTGWSHATRGLAWAVVGFAIGFLVRDTFPPPNAAVEFLLPAVYAATGAVLACWTG